jgi:hypothetical protein
MTSALAVVYSAVHLARHGFVVVAPRFEFASPRRVTAVKIADYDYCDTYRYTEYHHKPDEYASVCLE